MQNRANLVSGKSVALLVALADVESAFYGIIIRFLQGSIECVKSIPFIARPRINLIRLDNNTALFQHQTPDP